MVSTTAATVSSSLSAGNTTETVRPPFARSSSATVQLGWSQLLASAHTRVGPAPVMLMPDLEPYVPGHGVPGSRPPCRLLDGWTPPREHGTPGRRPPRPLLSLP